MQLQARGFVEVRSRVGWYVIEPSFDDALETHAARRVIEPGMLRDAGTPLQTSIRRLRQHVADERKAIAAADAAQRSWLLADFHICLAECLGNRFLTSMLIDLSARTTLVSALYQSQSEAQTLQRRPRGHRCRAGGRRQRAGRAPDAGTYRHPCRASDASAPAAAVRATRLRSALAPDMPAVGARRPASPGRNR